MIPLPRPAVRILAGAAAALLLLLAAGAPPALAAKASFDPAGAVLEGTERQPSLGKTPVSLHLGADGSAAASLLDPLAIAIGWTGTWTLEEGLLVLDLDPVNLAGDPVRIDLRVKGSGAGKGTITRLGAETVVTKAKVKAVFPAAKAKPGTFTAVLPRIRNTPSTAAGSFRGTLVLRNLLPAGPRAKPLALSLRAATPEGLPGAALALALAPGGTVRLEGAALPPLPAGVESTALQVVVTGGKGFGPAAVEILAFEEVLKGTVQTAVSGAPVPVAWARRLTAAEHGSRRRAPLLAPWFRDDGGAGTLPRDARLVLRDLSPFTGDAAPGAVRVSVRTLAGAEVASAEVDLPRGAAVEVRPRDLLASPGDLPDGEGRLLVTEAGGGDLPRGLLAAALPGTVTSGATPVAPLFHALAEPEDSDRSARIAAPYLLAPDDGGGECRIRVGSLSPDPLEVPVEVRALDGTLLHASTVTLPAGGTARVDPDALGMDLSLLPGGEGQLTVGGAGGIPVRRFVVHGETRLIGSPDTFFTAPVLFESAHGDGDPFRVDLLDAQETQGSGAGSRDAWLLLRNGGSGALDLVFHAFLDDDAPLGVPHGVARSVPAGASLRLSVEDLLAEAGVPLSPDPAVFRGTVVLSGTAAGPLAATAVQVRRSLEDTGGRVAPAPIR